MKEINSNNLKSIQIVILDKFSEYCKLNNLKYSLAYGTALGAVRHKGYIPWDDDVDVMMPRKDYEYFINNFNKSHNDIKCYSYPNNTDYCQPFAKICAENTVMNEYLYNKDCYGVYIDLFPIDGVKNSLQVSFIAALLHALNAKKAVNLGFRSVYKKMLIIIGKIILYFISVQKIVAFIQKYSRRHNINDALFACVLCSTTAKKEVLPKNIYEECVDIEFEGKKYFIVKDYDTYLHACYGDYMSLPPLNKRESTHKYKAYWKYQF